MNDTQQLAKAAGILGRALIEISEVLEAKPEMARLGEVVLPTGSQRNVPVRKDGTAKMWARPQEERNKALATVLGEFVRNQGVLDVEAFKAVAVSVGYDTRGLAGFSTAKANLVIRDVAQPSRRLLTQNGYNRYREIAAADLI